MKFIIITTISLFFSALFSLGIAAQTTNQPTTEDLQKRVTEMEAEMKMMREELINLKKSLPANQQTAQIPADKDNSNAAVNSIAKTEIKTETKPETKPNQVPDKQAKPLGIEIGSARLIPYGTIFFNAFGNSGGTNNADIPLFATPTGAGNASASARQTRLGMRVEGAKVGKARLSAILEADFFGGFPSVAIGENFGVVRLRLANARLDWEKTSVTVGQDWMVFAPVNPTSIAAGAIPQMAAAGNAWARMPQIKIERKLNENLTWAGAILAPQTGDYPTASNFFLQPNSGAASRTPFFQNRLSYADKNLFGTGKNGAVGVSAHYGRSRVFTGAANIRNDVDSIGIALDWNIPLSKQINLAGEAFWGRNVGGFQAGVFQSVNSDFAYRSGNRTISGGVRGIATRGGWTQLGYTPNIWKKRLSILGSIGIDDPQNKDLMTFTPRDFRLRNMAYAFDLIYKFTPQFQIGTEFRRLQTDYFLSGRENSNHVNLGAAYSF